ncbi:MAG: 16S rRNA (guanine(966)-N(2))-methyltransferase [uncultured Nocardioidaceae bacterium]|uniref:16S rRNA (Guanine(966)-N(2))-methyltransferase n=1 Tax=uncultured Nocardioidaceae bacterium TaxID=253824 RepID=A0A6J4MTP1_9ACTN|nr:MAG: 16S rRNA (guanine(966)-N(2))-methyltransferase [uncultured Nocardioidaceae bacterium]
MTRIIAGSAGGRRIQTPRGRATRPTSDRVREALFSAIEANLGSFAGRRFLDLYAGSGAVGLEAGSRGAAAVTLVEQDRSTAALIRTNARVLGLPQVTVVAGAAQRWAEGPHDQPPYDAVFADPPYDEPAADVAAVLAALHERARLAPTALVVVERARRDPPWGWPAGFWADRSKRYGDTTLWYGHAR